jgi:hypothetical protein
MGIAFVRLFVHPAVWAAVSMYFRIVQRHIGKRSRLALSDCIMCARRSGRGCRDERQLVWALFAWALETWMRESVAIRQRELFLLAVPTGATPELQAPSAT